MTTDAYAAAASMLDLASAAYRPAQTAAVDRWLPMLRTAAGPVLDVGAGSGAVIEQILRAEPSATVLALEPSPSMRALALSRLARFPTWHARVTIRPEDFFSAALPDRLAGAVLLGVLGHFTPDERRAVLAALAARLPVGTGALVDLQLPLQPTRMDPVESTIGRIGALEYRMRAHARPLGGERMQWTMTYRCLDDGRVLTEETAVTTFHHPEPACLAREVEQAGFTPLPCHDERHLLLVRS